MGYYTDYSLTYDNGAVPSETNKAIEEMFKTFDGGEWEYYPGQIWGCERKWYDQELDMYCLSNQFPDILFTLSGNGDDSDDIWEEHWQDGCMQHCHMTIPPYDPDQMVRMELDGEGRLVRASPDTTQQDESIKKVKLSEVI